MQNKNEQNTVSTNIVSNFEVYFGGLPGLKIQHIRFEILVKLYYQ